MICPQLSELPDPPPGKTGWPWTSETPKSEQVALDHKDWPRLSIITPSFNQGKYLEETIRSVLLQGYSDLEYFVMDGGSTDESSNIIKRYAGWLTYWESKPDRGQAHALNKALLKCSGDMVGWVNSDDGLLPGVVDKLASAYLKNPTSIIVGDVILFSETIRFKRTMVQDGVTFQNMVQNWNLDLRWSQPGTYIPRELLQKVGGFDENLRYQFDRDLMCRLLQIAPVSYIHYPIARFRMHPNSKTVAEFPKWLLEQMEVTQRYWNKIDGIDKKLARAEIELWFGALPYLSVLRGQFNRIKALTHLKKALTKDWRITFSKRFLLICFLLVTPQKVLKVIRGYFDY